MSRRLILAIPALVAVAFVVGVLATGANRWFFAVEIPLLKFSATVGCVAAMLRYGRRDYLFWAWFLLAVNYGSLCFNDLSFGGRIQLLHVAEPLAERLSTAIIVISNVAAAVSAFMMARTWRVAGLGLPSPWWEKLVVAGGIALAIAVVGTITWPDFVALFHHPSINNVLTVATCLGDLVCFCVIAPLFLQTMALRGGTLALPWSLIVASDVAWMVFDVLINSAPHVGHTTRIVAAGFRTMACAFCAAAGLAQRWATRAS
jgi:hypothetical protein